uniref:Uncharacterized protein n=1 Tax=Rhizophora mucronata TaxID=61149 RepID=A0A2P2QGU4_RHIMU
MLSLEWILSDCFSSNLHLPLADGILLNFNFFSLHY